MYEFLERERYMRGFVFWFVLIETFTYPRPWGVGDEAMLPNSVIRNDP